MKLTTIFSGTLAILITAALPVWAQMPVAPAGEELVTRPAGELDQLLAPIALYPDPLVAQILPATTLPAQIVLADRYVQSGQDVNLIDQQPWDPSVRALAHYPGVLKYLDDNLTWSTELGQAFLSQPQDVMDSVQRLRAQAQALGNLQSTAQQQVIDDNGDIEIVPANPDMIYVPVYQPDVIYFQAGFPLFSFGIGFAIGGWLNHDCDWHNHEVIVWRHDSPRPRDWWYHQSDPRYVHAAVDHRVAWHPRAAAPAVVNREDRGWGNTARPVANNIRPEPSHIEARQAPREVQPVRPEVRPEVQQRAPEVRPEARPEARPAVAAPVQHAPAARPVVGGAFTGVQSSRDTQEFSNRGQASRATIATPHAAPVSPAPAPSQGGNQRKKY